MHPALPLTARTVQRSSSASPSLAKNPRQDPPMLTEHIAETVRSSGRVPPRAQFFTSMTLRSWPQRSKTLKARLPEGVAVYYAMKANPHVAFLETARRAGVEGIEIASVGEGKKAIEAGFRAWADHIHRAGQVARGTGMERVGRHPHHPYRIPDRGPIGSTPSPRLRGASRTCWSGSIPISTSTALRANFSGDSSKLGMDQDKFRASLPEILALENLNFLGLHVYSASGVLEVSSLFAELRTGLRPGPRDREPVSGRHPVQSSISAAASASIILNRAAISRPSPMPKGLSKLIARFGFAGRRFCPRTGTLSHRRQRLVRGPKSSTSRIRLGKKQVVCAGGSHHFRRPAALGINHPVSIVADAAPESL